MQYQPKALIKDGLPQNTDGYEGEIRFGKLNGSIHQFVRMNNEWHSIPFSKNVGEALTETIKNIKVETRVLASQTISTIICDTIKIKDSLLDDAGNSVDSTLVLTHPTNQSQAHTDYLLNQGNDEMDGTLKIKGISNQYSLNVTGGSSGHKALWVGNPDYANDGEFPYRYKLGIGVEGINVLGRFHVQTQNQDFIIEDSGNVKLQSLELESGITIPEGGTLVIGSATVIDGDLDLTVATVDTGPGAAEVYPATTPTDTLQIAFSGGDVMSGTGGTASAISADIVADSIKDAQLAFNTGQDLSPASPNTSVASKPNFTTLGLGNLANATIPLHIDSSNESKISMLDNEKTTIIGSDNLGNLLIQPHAEQDIWLPVDSGIGSTGYASGFQGTGWNISPDASGEATLDIQNINVRGSMSVYELLIQQIRATNGSLLIGSADKVVTIEGFTGSCTPANPGFEVFTDSEDLSVNDTFDSWEVSSYYPGRVKGNTNLTYVKTGTKSLKTFGSGWKRFEPSDISSLVDGESYLYKVWIYLVSSSASFYMQLRLSSGGLVEGETKFTVTDSLIEGQWAQLQIPFTWSSSTMNVLNLYSVNTAEWYADDFSLTTNGSKFTTEADDADNPTAGMCHFKKGDLVIAKKWDTTDGAVGNYVTRKLTVLHVTDSQFNATIDEGSITQASLPLDFVRVGSNIDTNRQGGVYLTSDDVNAPFIDVFDGITSWGQFQHTDSVKARLGDISAFTGGNNYGLYSDTVVLTGDITATSGYIGAADKGWTITAEGLVNNSSGTDTRIGIGTGEWGAAAQKFWVDGAGRFSLGDKLTWDPAANEGAGELIVDGTITLPAITGADITDFTFDDLAAETVNAGTPDGLHLTALFLGFTKNGTYKTWMDANGNLGLIGSGGGTSNSLYWDSDAGTLSIIGAITATSGSFTGGVTIGQNGALQTTGTTYGTEGIFIGDADSHAELTSYQMSLVGSGGSLLFDGDGNVEVTGKITATSGDISGAITLGGGTMKIGEVASGVKGIYVDGSNYWYDDGTFSLGDGKITGTNAGEVSFDAATLDFNTYNVAPSQNFIPDHTFQDKFNGRPSPWNDIPADRGAYEASGLRLEGGIVSYNDIYCGVAIACTVGQTFYWKFKFYTNMTGNFGFYLRQYDNTFPTDSFGSSTGHLDYDTLDIFSQSTNTVDLGGGWWTAEGTFTSPEATLAYVVPYLTVRPSADIGDTVTFSEVFFAKVDPGATNAINLDTSDLRINADKITISGETEFLSGSGSRDLFHFNGCYHIDQTDSGTDPDTHVPYHHHENDFDFGSGYGTTGNTSDEKSGGNFQSGVEDGAYHLRVYGSGSKKFLFGKSDTNAFSQYTKTIGAQSGLIPFNPDAKYELSCRAGTTSSGTNKFSIGYQCFNAAGSRIDEQGNTLGSDTLSLQGGAAVSENAPEDYWQVFRGWIQGTQDIGDTSGGSTLNAPHRLVKETAYISIMIQVFSGDVVNFDWVKLREVETGSTFIDGDHIRTGSIQASHIDVENVISAGSFLTSNNFGSTTISGGQITTGIIKKSTGNTQFDLTNDKITLDHQDGSGHTTELSGANGLVRRGYSYPIKVYEASHMGWYTDNGQTGTEVWSPNSVILTDNHIYNANHSTTWNEEIRGNKVGYFMQQGSIAYGTTVPAGRRLSFIITPILTISEQAFSDFSGGSSHGSGIFQVMPGQVDGAAGYGSVYPQTGHYYKMIYLHTGAWNGGIAGIGGYSYNNGYNSLNARQMMRSLVASGDAYHTEIPALTNITELKLAATNMHDMDSHYHWYYICKVQIWEHDDLTF